MRFSIDANVLIYSVDPHDERGVTARRLLGLAVTADCVLTNQVIGEFLKVVKSKDVVSTPEARRTATDWSVLFPIAPTSTSQLIAASVLAEQRRLQFWDAVILTVAKDAGAEYLISEDMQNRSVVDGVEVFNPFDLANAELLDLLLKPQP